MDLEHVLRGLDKNLKLKCPICNNEIVLLRDSVPMSINNRNVIIHRDCMDSIDLDNYAKCYIREIIKDEDDEGHIPYKTLYGDYFYIHASYSNGIGLSKSCLYLPRSTMIEYDEGWNNDENPNMISERLCLMSNTPNLFFFIKCLNSGEIVPGKCLHRDRINIKNEDYIPEINIKCYQMVGNYLEVLVTEIYSKQTLFLLDKDIEMMKNTDFSVLFDKLNEIEWKTMRELFEEEEF